MGLYDRFTGFDNIDTSNISQALAEAQAAPVYTPPPPPQKETGIVSGTFKSLGRGIAGIGEQAGQAMEWNPDYELTRTTQNPQGDESRLSMMNIAGRKLKQASERVKESIAAPVGNSFGRKSWFSGLEPAPASFAYAVPGYVGAAIGAGLGVADSGGLAAVPQAIAGAAIGQAPSAAIMYRSAAQEHADTLRKLNPTIDSKSLVDAAVKAGHAEWMGESLSDVPMNVLFSRLPGFSGVIKSVREGIKPAAKQIAKNMLTTQLAEQLGENYTTWQQTKALNEALPQDKQIPMGQALLDTVGSTAVLSLLMGGAGTAAQYYQGHRIEKALTDPKADQERRGEAAGKVYGLLKEAEKEKITPHGSADNFLYHAIDAIGDRETTGSEPYALDLTNPKILEPFQRNEQSPGVPSPDATVETASPAGIPSDPAGAFSHTTIPNDMVLLGPDDIPIFGQPDNRNIVVDRDNSPGIFSIIGDRRAARGLSTMPANTGIAPIAEAPILQDAPAGPLVNAVRSGLASVRGIAGIADMVGDRRDRRGPSTMPADTGIVPTTPVYQPTELDKAHAWATEQIAAGKGGHLMQGYGVSAVQHDAKVLDYYRRSKQGKGTISDAVDNSMPALQTAPQVDGTGVEVPGLRDNHAGWTGDRGSEGGLNGVSTVRQETVTPQKMSSVRSDAPVIPVVSKTPSTTSRRQLDPTRDDLVTAMSKLGGLDLRQARQQWGTTINDDVKALNRHAGKTGGTGIAFAIHTKGIPLDSMREKLVEHGYLPEDATINDLADAIHAAARGNHTYSSHADIDTRLDQAEQEWLSRQDVSQLLAFSQDELDAVGYHNLEPAEQQAVDEIWNDIETVLSDLFETTDRVHFGELNELIQGVRNEISKELAGYTITPEPDAVHEKVSEEKQAKNLSDGERIDGNIAQENQGTGDSGLILKGDTHDEVAETSSDAVQEREANGYESNIQEAAVPEEQAVRHDVPESRQLSVVSPESSAPVSESAGVSERKNEGGVSDSQPGETTEVTREEIKARNRARFEESRKKYLIKKLAESREPSEKARLQKALEKLKAEQEKRDVKGRDMFTPEQLAGFDRHNIDVSGVTSQYKTEALQQLEFQEKQQEKLAAPDYNQHVQNEQDRIAREQAIVHETGNGVIRKTGKSFEVEWSNGDTQTLNKLDDAKRALMLGKDQAQFVEAPHGSVDFGSITPEIGSEIRREAAPIRLRQGDSREGLRHIVERYGKEITALGYSNASHFVADVASGFTAIYKGRARTLSLIKGNGQNKLLYVELEESPDGAYYDVKSAMPVRKDFLKNKELLWERAQSNQPISESPSAITGQSNSSDVTIVTPATENVKPGSKSTITDSGEELTYNKRNRIKTGIAWEDIANKNDALKVKEVQKNNVYPKPDYAAMIQEGMHPGIAHVVKQVYDSMAAKPVVRGLPTDADFQRYITALKRVMDGVLAWANNADSVRAFTRKSARTAEAYLGEKTEISDLAPSKTLLDTVYPNGWKEHKEEMYILGGNKALGALQPGVDELIRAMKDIEKGWPGNIESWQRQGLKIVPKEAFTANEGSQPGDRPTVYTIRLDRSYITTMPTEAAAKEYLTGLRNFVLLDKRGNVAGSYASEEEARQAAREAVKKEKKPRVAERGVNIADVERTGPARRMEGEDITSAQLRDTFGFRGVNFGNWVPQDERQLHLNHAYDSFQDLADILSAPPKALSLNGMLGLAIGAQGGGTVAAHFVPGVNEINITRTAGAGSLAHEWAHALDHYFATMAGYGAAPSPWLSVLGKNKENGEVRPEILKAFKDIVSAMRERKQTAEEAQEKYEQNQKQTHDRLNRWLDHIGAQFKVNDEAAKGYAELAHRIRQGDYQHGDDAYVQITPARTRGGGVAVLSVVSDIRELAKKNGIQLSLNDIKALHQSVSFAKYLDEKQTADHKPQLVMSAYHKAALALDKGKNKKYWSTNPELFARAFDTYVTDKLAEKEQANNYLSHTGREGETVPSGDERTAIGTAFDALIETLKTKETDKGTLLYSTTQEAYNTPAAYITKVLQQAIAMSRVPVRILQSLSELPEHIQSDMRRRGIPVVDGVFDPKTTAIYLVSDHIFDAIHARELLRHEWFHAGVADKELEAIYTWYSRKDMARLQNIARERGFNLNTRPGRLEAAGELAAQLAETSPRNLFLLRLVKKIKDWLGALGFEMNVGMPEVAEMIHTAIGRVTGTEQAAGVRPLAGSAYSAAWHGSPHDFERFSSERIGTGEGAQAYGYGLYFAGKKEVAEHYRNSLSSASDVNVFIGGNRVEWTDSGAEFGDYYLPNNSKEYHYVLSPLNQGQSIDDIIEHIKEMGWSKDVLDFATEIKSDGIEQKAGNLYHVELAPQEDEYLLWDKPLSEQSEKVREALKQAGFVATFDEATPDIFQWGDITGRQIYTTIQNHPNVKKNASPIIKTDHVFGDFVEMNSQQAASTYLHSLGIRGIKYLDGSSRNKGEGHYNYVIFDDKDVSITAKYSVPKTRQDKTYLYGYNNDYATFNELSRAFEQSSRSTYYSTPQQDAAIADHARENDAPGKVTAMTQHAFDLAGSYLPPKLKAAIGTILSNPWFGSAGKAIRRMVVNLNIERSHVRNELIFDLFRASEGYAGVEGLRNLLKTATKAERKQFNELIKYGDRNDIATTFTRDELYRGKTPFGKLSRTVVEAYKAFHQIIQAANRVRFEKLSQIALLPYQNETWYPELLDMLDLRMRLDHGLTPDQAGQLTKCLSSTRRRMSDAELMGDNNPTGKPVAKEVAAAYQQWMEKLETTSNPGLVRMAYKHITEYRGELDKIKNEWGHVKGYAPRLRKDGDFHVSVYRINDDGSRTKVYMNPTRTEAQARSAVAKVRGDLKGYLKSNFDAHAVYDAAYERNTATPSELLSDRGKEQAIEQLIMTAFDKANVFKTSAEDLAAMKRAVLDEVNKQIMAQGFGRHGISREANFIEGYRDDDYVAVLQEFISGMAGWLSKMQYAVEVNREAARIADSNPDDKVWIHDYFKDSMKNSTYLDEVAATARSLGALYYLGFKVSSAILNAFQNYTVGQAALAGMMKKAGRKGEPVMILLKAQRDMLAHATGGKKLSAEEQQVLHQAVRQGTAHAQAVRYMSGLSEQGFGSKYKKLVEIGMTPFSWVEQYVNREPGVLAAYRAFKTTPAGTFDQKAFEKVEEFTNNAHFLMGNENLPWLVRKLGPVGKMAYLFQGYTHNYLHFLANALKNGEFNVIARSFGAIAALGGVFALPGADDMDKWITKWFGKSYKLQFKYWMKHNLKDYGSMGEAIEAFVNHGAPSVAGIDMSRAIGVNIPFVSDPDKSFGEAVGGVWGGMAKKPVMAAHALGSGQYYRAIESMMPEFIANPMRAYRQYQTSATTLAGKPILDETGHQMQYSAIDAAKKTLGFNPINVSERTELKGAEKALTAQWADERKDKLAALRVATTPEETRQAVLDIMRWNRSLALSQAKGLVTPITSDSIRRARTFRPGKNDRNKIGWEKGFLE